VASSSLSVKQGRDALVYGTSCGPPASPPPRSRAVELLQ